MDGHYNKRPCPALCFAHLTFMLTSVDPKLISADVLQGDSASIWDGIHYANFIIENVISEQAILTFCTDLLLRGPLPAGEVGKLLSETTCIPQLSHRYASRTFTVLLAGLHDWNVWRNIGKQQSILWLTVSIAGCS